MSRKDVGKRNESAQKEQYLKGLKEYRKQGIPILIDGEEIPEEDWGKIFEVREDYFFYMADFVPNEKTGKIQEIRFDQVYNH